MVVHADGSAHVFGSNACGQLGTVPLSARCAPLRLRCRHGGRFVQAAAGSRHTVLLTDDGQVLTCGAHQVSRRTHQYRPAQLRGRVTPAGIWHNR